MRYNIGNRDMANSKQMLKSLRGSYALSDTAAMIIVDAREIFRGLSCEVVSFEVSQPGHSFLD